MDTLNIPQVHESDQTHIICIVLLASVCSSPDPHSLPSPRLAQAEAGVNCEYYWMES